MTYEIRVDWIDSTGKKKLDEPLDELLMCSGLEKGDAKQRAEYYAGRGFWRGTSLVPPSQILRMRIRQEKGGK